MKAVAATLLNQPNRPARDYRGISAEYQARLFQDDHDVRPYYAACFLNYKLDFLWRNQRLDNALRIYRYYLLSVIGHSAFGGRDVFAMKKTDIETASNRLIQLGDDEQKLKEVLQKVHAILQARVTSLNIGTRERLRDAIRSESFAKSFDADLQSAKIAA